MRRRFKWLSILLVAGLVASWWLGQSNNLFDNAQRIADASTWGLNISGWRNGSTIRVRSTYDWIDDNRVLSYPGTQPVKVAWSPLQVTIDVPLSGDPAIYDVSTRKYEKLLGLRSRYSQSGGIGNQSARLSPRGDRLVWRLGVGSRDFHVARLDGSEAHAWSGGMPYFSGDGRLFEDLYDHERRWVGLRCRDTGAVYRSAPFEMVMHIYGERGYSLDFPRSEFMSDCDPVKRATLMSVALRNEPDVREYDIRLPCESTIVAAKFSRDSRRILWILFDRRPSAAMAFFSRYVPGLFAQKSRSVTTLWVSDLQGGNWRNLGEAVTADSLPAIEPQLVRWLPSGKAISFYHDRSLWRLPVD